VHDDDVDDDEVDDVEAAAAMVTRMHMTVRLYRVALRLSTPDPR
jgi:hypothetical protein